MSSRLETQTGIKSMAVAVAESHLNVSSIMTANMWTLTMTVDPALCCKIYC